MPINHTTLAQFFGREEVLELLGKRVLALKDGYRQNIAFTGQSLAGKTSILSRFLYTIKDEECIAIYIEVVKEPFRSFANRFIATLLYNTITKSGHHVEADIDSLMEKCQRAFPKTYLAIKQTNALIDKADLDEAYTSLLGLTSIMKDEIKMPCIVILDEFDNLEHLGVKNPFLNFGKMIMVQKDTMYIVTSSRNQAIKKILSEKLSLLFGNFEIVKVAGFDHKAASDFINTRLPDYEIADEVRRFLIAFSEGNPFYLNQLLKAARVSAAARMSNYIDRETLISAMLDQFYDSSGVLNQYLSNFLLELIDTKHRPRDIPILIALAGGKNKKQEIARSLKLRPHDVSKSLEGLAELGLISKNGIFYRIDDGVLEFWLKHFYQKRKEMLVHDLFNLANTFENSMRLYAAGYIAELDKDIMVKTAELFNLFSNELVPIDSKPTKLPHFTKVEIRTSGDSRPFITATFRGKSWIVSPYTTTVDENAIIDYMRNIKSIDTSTAPNRGLEAAETSAGSVSTLSIPRPKGRGSRRVDNKIANKVIIPLAGMDENAKLLAKELKISIWDTSVVNMLLVLYGKKRFAIL